MGQQKASKQKFLEEHPTCCFCGRRPSETRDHIPSRDFFIDKTWPEGYEFPACTSCNHNSSTLENVVAFYLNAMNFDGAQYSAIETEKRINALLNNAPDVFPRAIFGSSERKKVIRSLGLRLRPGETTEDYPAVGINRSLHIAFHVFYSKLLCALFYKHLGEIAPDNNYFYGRWGQYMSQPVQDFVQQINQSMTNEATLLRGGKNLHEQFKYNYYLNEETHFLTFIAQFRKSFFVCGAVGKFDEPPDENWQKCTALPFR